MSDTEPELPPTQPVQNWSTSGSDEDALGSKLFDSDDDSTVSHAYDSDHPNGKHLNRHNSSQVATMSRTSELTDFKILLQSLEYNHRRSLSDHLIVASRLTARHRREVIDRNRISLAEDDELLLRPKPIIPAYWTAWPMHFDELPPEYTNESACYEYTDDLNFSTSTAAFSGKNAKSQSMQELRDPSYEHYRFPGYKLFGTPDFSRRLVAEISAVGVRCVTKTWQATPNFCAEEPDLSSIVYSGSEMEKELLYPYLHASILQLVDGIVDSVIAMRKRQRRKNSRRRLLQINWNDILNVAALRGMPGLEETGSKQWIDIITQAQERCKQLVEPEGKIKSYKIVKNTVRQNDSLDPIQVVRGIRPSYQTPNKKLTAAKTDMQSE
ncbi:uncharacterized protein V1518DRAFT_409920 [Limtongia smithiae]|uniref:uncharacterized protein n=1 Tax=Limtongia smithiae TaxID=1125753 RepID=UPI0034CF702A